jgi:hypothetical protein
MVPLLDLDGDLDGVEFWEFLYTEGNTIFLREIPESLRLHIGDVQTFYTRFVWTLQETWTRQNSTSNLGRHSYFPPSSTHQIAAYTAGPNNPPLSPSTDHHELGNAGTNPTSESFNLVDSANPVFQDLPTEPTTDSADSGFYSGQGGGLQQQQQPQQQVEFVHDPVQPQRPIHPDSLEEDPYFGSMVDFEAQHDA